MALFNYNDLLNESTFSTDSASSSFSYDYLNENSMFKSESAIDLNEYKEFDIFLSHSYDDRKIIPALKRQLELLGYSVYVDWINDKLMSRQNVTPKTAKILQKRMNQSKSLFYATSENTPNSKWMPWELGYFDGLKDKRVAILPLKKNNNFSENFKGQEYLGLYYYVDISQLSNSTKKALFINESSNKYANYDRWLNGEEPYNR
jgi:hypothetical protein